MTYVLPRVVYDICDVCHLLVHSAAAVAAFCPAGQIHQVQQQLRQLQQRHEETALQLHFARDEAAELRQAKEAAVVEKEQLTVRLERRTQQQQVRKCVGSGKGS